MNFYGNQSVTEGAYAGGRGFPPGGFRCHSGLSCLHLLPFRVQKTRYWKMSRNSFQFYKNEGGGGSLPNLPNSSGYEDCLVLCLPITTHKAGNASLANRAAIYTRSGFPEDLSHNWNTSNFDVKLSWAQLWLRGQWQEYGSCFLTLTKLIPPPPSRHYMQPKNGCCSENKTCTSYYCIILCTNWNTMGIMAFSSAYGFT